MMVSSEVQRTLVKSPPELWAELSDPASLARHLGELGEIRITKTKPEERVEWEAERISGTVSMKASGWGTKVTLSVTREAAEPVAAATEPKVEASEAAAAAPDAAVTAVKPGPALEVEVLPEAPSGAEADLELGAEAAPEPRAEPAPIVEARRGFFSRLFRRGTHSEPVATSQPELEPALAIVAPEPEPRPEPIRVESAIESLEARFLVELDHAQTEPEPSPPAASVSEEIATSESPQTPTEISAELEVAEKISADEMIAVLTAMLDRLGAAHHRPFSRS